MVKQRTLASLNIGEKAIVIGFTDEILSLKFLEMGLLPGTELILNQTAPMGDPIAIKIADYILAIRIDEAETVLVI